MSTSEFFGGAPEFEVGDVFLDCCLLATGASEPSLGDSVAVGGRDGLSVLAAVGCDLGAMVCVTVNAVIPGGSGRKPAERGADLVQCSRRRENEWDGEFTKVNHRIQVTCVSAGPLGLSEHQNSISEVK